MILYRPVGPKELKRIEELGMKAFPPRLPEQPIFYPVLNLEYARQITKSWNVKKPPNYSGFVTEFEVDDLYIKQFEVKTVGSSIHQELWIPAEELENFNKHIIGKIRVIEAYYLNNALKSLNFIDTLRSGDFKVLKTEKWLSFLALVSEASINFERLHSLEEFNKNYTLGYVEKTLRLLEDVIQRGYNGITLNDIEIHLIEETLKWSEVAKGGMQHQRQKWIDKGYNLFAHNVGSTQIYLEYSNEEDTKVKRIISDLILTHGLVGQYIRGEVPLKASTPLYQLVSGEIISKNSLLKILKVLNYCIIAAVDYKIWQDISEQAEEVIEQIISGNWYAQHSTSERIRRLRTVSIQNGENLDEALERLFAIPGVESKMTRLLEKMDLWYVEAALFDFTIEEFIKVFLIIERSIDVHRVRHISFERWMKDIYYQNDGRKRVNIYKKRIIEKYLSQITIEDIFNGKYPKNVHVTHEILQHEHLRETVFFNFRFSPAGSKLIDFCVEAEKSDVLYESAIIVLFDLFGLRKDAYDRFYQEEDYLNTMNQAIDHKRIILDYITGNRIIDIGPGGGALMDLITERYPDKEVIGVDIASNVLDSLKKRKQLEKCKWDVLYGDALNLSEYINSADTVIFCSILHELFSYIEYNGRKFNHETLAQGLKSAWDILPVGGRIIIRDGIMSESESTKRIIKFLSEEGMEFLKRYVSDFKGREIQYTLVGQNEVMMPINDAMEFLYTYTWGEKSYVHEVNEQFGYFTPSGFKDFITKVLGEKAKIIEFKHYLQDGYTIALSQKITFMDENRNPVRLPDSTCLVVIEKN